MYFVFLKIPPWVSKYTVPYIDYSIKYNKKYKYSL